MSDNGARVIKYLINQSAWKPFYSTDYELSLSAIIASDKAILKMVKQ